MIRKLLIASLLLSLMAALGAGGYLARNNRNLGETIADLEKNGRRLEKKMVLLKKKYAEEKARAGGLLRAKTRVEGQQRKLEKELAQLKEAIEEKAAKGQLAAKAAEARIATLTKKLERAQNRFDALEKRRQKLKEKLVLAADTIKEQGEDLQRRQEETNRLRGELGQTERDLNRCRTHNRKLCTIAGELVEKYQTKGVGDALFQNEPFTGIKQIEVETIIQEYQDRIEDQNLDAQGG